MAEMKLNVNNNSSSGSTGCVVCYKNVDIYSIGMCEHPVCYECSTRMRVLCKQNECPICRQDLPKVVFTREIRQFRHIHRGNRVDSRYNIYFETPDIQEKFFQLLIHICNICDETQVFSNFNGLKDHMRKSHELHYCDLCVENLKIFSHERRCYTRADLAQHRRKGDPDDKSHKGHPLCEFCDRRYIDNDELFRHLRRDHLYCHFCDADGLHQYYNSYDYLRDHFRQEHFLCEEDTCSEEKFTSVFRSEIDLKAHKASTHGRYLGKAATKQARSLALEFEFTPRGEMGQSRPRIVPGPSNSHNLNAFEYVNAERLEPTAAYEPVIRQPDVDSTQEFPSLSNDTRPPLVSQPKSQSRGNLTIRNFLNPRPLTINDEEFPALASGSNNGVSKTVNLNVYSSNRPQSANQRPQSAAPNLSIQVNHKTGGNVTTRVSGPNVRISPNSFARNSDFPPLGHNQASTSSANTVQWSKVIHASSKKKVAPESVLDSSARGSRLPDFNKDFPNLPQTTKARRQSSSSVTSNNGSSSSFSFSQTWLTDDGVFNSTSDTNTTNKKKKKKKKVKKRSSGNASSSPESTASKRNEQVSKPTNVVIDDEEKTKNSQSNAQEDNTKPTNGIRKRSELKIDSLNNSNNSGRNAEEFPALEMTTKSRTVNPPPGFSTITLPPPGFSAKLTSAKAPRDNGLIFTNSSGESFSILPDDSKLYSYICPPDFKKRNKNLVIKISDALQDQKESIEEFKYFSGLFRRGALSVEDYYKRCCSAIGADAFQDIFPEMLVLLPDISKQGELFDVHRREVRKVQTLDLCPTCAQVVKIGNDLTSHAMSHTFDSNYPSLDAASVQRTNTQGQRGA